MRPFAWLLAIAITAQTVIASAQPAITRPVTDEAGVLSSDAVAAIETRLRAHREAGHAQIALLIVRTMHGVPIPDYAMRAAEAWGGGSRARDDGVLFVLAIADRDMRIEVGYGLESAIPDSAALRILDGLVEPMRAGRFDAAAWMVSDALIARTGGASAPIPAALEATSAELPPDTTTTSPPLAETDEPPPQPAATSPPALDSAAPSSTVPTSDAAATERQRERVQRDRERIAWLALGGLGFVVLFALVLAYLRRPSAYEYDADGAQHASGAGTAEALAALRAFGGGGAGERGRARSSSHETQRSSGAGGASGHSRRRSSRSSSYVASAPKKSYGGGGGKFGGGGASKRW